MDPRAPPGHSRYGPTGSGERARKGIHIAAAFGAIAVIVLVPPTAARILLTGTALLALAVEIARRRSPAFGAYFIHTFGALLKPGEHRRITGATTLALGFAVTSIIFPPHVALLGILYAGLADAVAALVGRRFGRLRTSTGKSLEGSVAFFLTALAAGWALPWLPFLPAVIAALVVTAVEATPLPGDDNLLIPIIGAAAGFVALAVFG